jgi:hypothetical protein
MTRYEKCVFTVVWGLITLGVVVMTAFISPMIPVFLVSSCGALVIIAKLVMMPVHAQANRKRAARNLRPYR